MWSVCALLCGCGTQSATLAIKSSCLVDKFCPCSKFCIKTAAKSGIAAWIFTRDKYSKYAKKAGSFCQLRMVRSVTSTASASSACVNRLTFLSRRRSIALSTIISATSRCFSDHVSWKLIFLTISWRWFYCYRTIILIKVVLTRRNSDDNSFIIRHEFIYVVDVLFVFFFVVSFNYVPFSCHFRHPFFPLGCACVFRPLWRDVRLYERKLRCPI